MTIVNDNVVSNETQNSCSMCNSTVRGLKQCAECKKEHTPGVTYDHDLVPCSSTWHHEASL